MLGAVRLAACLGAVTTIACGGEVCLDGSCPAPCDAITFVCETPTVSVGRLGARGGSGLDRGQAGVNDWVLDNGLVTAVIADVGPDSGSDLATSGGTLIDYGPSGGRDDITQIYQLAGILPDDTFTYTALEVEDGAADRVAVTVRGTLDGRPAIQVVTRWELRACDPGVRVRTELFNGDTRAFAMVVADGMHWGKRRQVPFVPAPNQGFVQPELELLELSSLWAPIDFVAAAAPDPQAPSYGVIACDAPQLYGVNDLELTAVGTDIGVIAPGDTVAYERLITTAGAGAGIGPSLAALQEGRGQAFGQPSRVLAGRVVTPEGLAYGGDVRRASVLVYDDATTPPTPVAAVTPAADGTFTVRAPEGNLRVEVWSFGTARFAQTVIGNDVGDVVVTPAGTVQIAISARDGAAAAEPIEGLAVLVPADAATAAATTGTFHGQFAPCAPWLGPPMGGSPSCNRALVSPAGAEFEVPPGRYTVVASAGPEASLARAELEVVAGEVATVALEVVRLPLLPPGWRSADLHVHGAASFDSSLPDFDRVRSFVAAGVEVIAATDHDAITNYATAVAALGLEADVAVMGGLETTPLLPFLEIPGEDVPKVIGHFNFWPLAVDPMAPRGGAPFDERLEPGQLFDRMQPLLGDDGVRMMNHPWSDAQFGRDLGYLRAIGFDPRLPIGTANVNSPLAQAPGGGAKNGDWHAVEVINGAGIAEYVRARPVWFALLSQGLVSVGTGNSDSHALTDEQLGWARNWVQTSTTVGAFDAAVFNRDLRAGKAIAGTGVVVLAEVGPALGPRRGLGFTPFVPAAGDVLDVEVRSPPWVPVDEVRVVTSRRTIILARAADISAPTDPFATDGVFRWRGQIALAELATADDWVVVEAGLALPPVADLDDDGVPDTTDNNGDGQIDVADVEADEDAGPLLTPADPTSPADPRYWLTRVVPRAYPVGFANPFLIDVAGDGWQAPGVAPTGGVR